MTFNGAGLSAIAQCGTETTWGTFAAPTAAYRFLSESLNLRQTVIESPSLAGGGDFMIAERRVVAAYDAGGDIELEVPTVGVDLLLQHMMGASTLGVYTFGDLYGQSMTWQVGTTAIGGTRLVKSLSGAKFDSWELSLGGPDWLKLKATIDAGTYSVSETEATAVYASTPDAFHFGEGVVSLGGSPIDGIKDFTMSVSNNLKTDRYNIGNAGKKSEQVHNGFRELTISMNTEHIDDTIPALFRAASSTSVAFTFTGGGHSLAISVPKGFFTGSEPSVSGPGLVEFSAPFKAYRDAAGTQLVSITYA